MGIKGVSTIALRYNAAMQIRHILPNRQEANLALIITLGGVIGYNLMQWFNLPFGYWLPVMTTFLPFTKLGQTRLAQSYHLFVAGLLGALLVVVTVLCKVGLWLLLPWLFIAIFVLFSLPRYFAVSGLVSVFVTVFMVMAQGSKQLQGLDHALEAASMMLLGTLLTISINGLLSISGRESKVVELDRSNYLLKRAMRIATAVTFSQFVVHHFGFSNTTWVSYSVIVVAQASLGESIRKAWQRLLGTGLGICAGILLGHYIVEAFPQARGLIVPFVFFTFLYITRAYAIGIFFLTLLVAMTFYFLHGMDSSIYGFMLLRLMDTLVGVVIGISAELLIFPKTLLHPIRRLCRDILTQCLRLLDCCEQKPIDHRYLQQSIQQLRTNQQQLAEFFEHFRYEPYRLLSKRFHLCKQLPDSFNELIMMLERVSHLLEQLDRDEVKQQLLTHIREVVQLCLNTYPNTQTTLEEWQTVSENLVLMKQDLQSHLHAYPQLNQLGREIMTAINLLVIHYMKILQTPRWRLDFRA